MIFKDRLYKLDMLILFVLSNNDCTSETLTNILNKHTHQLSDIKDGIVFSHLYYLETSLLISSYIKDEDNYYHIESSGLVRLDMLKRQYYQTVKEIDNIINYQEDLK